MSKFNLRKKSHDTGKKRGFAVCHTLFSVIDLILLFYSLLWIPRYVFHDVFSTLFLTDFYHKQADYSVEVSLEKSIADEIGMDKSEFTLSSEEEVINLVGKVLGSERISAVVSNLINIE